MMRIRHVDTQRIRHVDNAVNVDVVVNRTHHFAAVE
jgi:hypothetical protein